MTLSEAIEIAENLNMTGKHREKWGYYPAWIKEEEFAVMRRLKNTEIHAAVFIDGKVSKMEHSK